MFSPIPFLLRYISRRRLLHEFYDSYLHDVEEYSIHINQLENTLSKLQPKKSRIPVRSGTDFLILASYAKATR